MRLSEHELESIKKTFQEMFSKTSFELRLYGSRTDDNKRGGDIDLLCITEDDQKKSKLHDKLLDLKLKLYDHIGEQKIDILIVTHSEVHSNPFVKMIYPDSIVLLAQNCL